MKVYVCESEAENDFCNMAIAVYSNLDDALEEMRVEYLDFKSGNPNAGIEWLENAELSRIWGWYDVDCTNSFTVRELELKGSL